LSIIHACLIEAEVVFGLQELVLAGGNCGGQYEYRISQYEKKMCTDMLGFWERCQRKSKNSNNCLTLTVRCAMILFSVGKF